MKKVYVAGFGKGYLGSGVEGLRNQERDFYSCVEDFKTLGKEGLLKEPVLYAGSPLSEKGLLIFLRTYGKDTILWEESRARVEEINSFLKIIRAEVNESKLCRFFFDRLAFLNMVNYLKNNHPSFEFFLYSSDIEPKS